MNRSIACLIDPACTGTASTAVPREPNLHVNLPRVLQTMHLWLIRLKQRRELQDLADDPNQLRDTGLSRSVVRREADKPFWRE